jgi:hypothetical protein
MRKFEKFEYPENMDAECVDLCNALNTLPGIKTVKSCCGHGTSPFAVWFRCSTNGFVDTRGLFFAARCVNARHWKYGHLWKLSVEIGDVPTMPAPVRYLLSSESQIGEHAYAQAKDLLLNMLMHLNNDAFLKSFYDYDGKPWYDRLGKSDWKSMLLLQNYDMLPSDGRMPVAMFGIECGEGWKGILEKLFDDIRSMSCANPGMPPVTVHQIKEKFGALRFYYDGGDENVAQAVRDAEHASYETCELCGTTENVGHTSGWILTCCGECHRTCDNEYVRAREWKPITEKKQ